MLIYATKLWSIEKNPDYKAKKYDLQKQNRDLINQKCEQWTDFKSA